MAKFVSMTAAALPNPEEDFRSAARVEQYRVSETALYIPEGFRWKYIPFAAIEKAEESFRVISGGHCVPVREKRPELDLTVGSEVIHVQLEKETSMQTILSAMKK